MSNTIGKIHKSSKDKTLSIYHQMGKIVLHSVPARECSLRVRLLPDRTLEALGRDASGVWSKDAPTAHEKFLAALQAHLARVETFAYWYINGDVVKQISKRFERSK